MDGHRFDELTKALANGTSRRKVLGGLVGGVVAALGLRGAEAQISCPNMICVDHPDICSDGCGCCVFTNGNSRCMEPSLCRRMGGTVIGSSTTTTTAAPTTTTTSTTTSTTTAPPTTTSTTSTTTTSTTTTAPTTTTTQPPVCSGTCNLSRGEGCTAPCMCSKAAGNGECVLISEACTNGVQDGNETDVDCGGPDCLPCESGMSCVAGTDCVSGHCASKTCS